jgi:hypothetical protein
VAQTVNDILLTSHGHGLRLFPIWAALRSNQSASFKTLRAKGAFLVSAEYDGLTQLVRGVKILSEAGTLCRLLSPWTVSSQAKSEANHRLLVTYGSSLTDCL